MSSVRSRHPALNRPVRPCRSRADDRWSDDGGVFMKAAILTNYGEPLVVEDITLAPLGPRSVHVHVDASGVCHSDLSAATGAVPLGAPMILGHEGTGIVLAIGSEVSRVQPGDRVIASFVPACGDCWFCLHDQSQLCE